METTHFIRFYIFILQMSSVTKNIQPLTPPFGANSEQGRSEVLKDPFSSEWASMVGISNKIPDSGRVKPDPDEKRQILVSTNPFFGDGYETEDEVDGLKVHSTLICTMGI